MKAKYIFILLGLFLLVSCAHNELKKDIEQKDFDLIEISKKAIHEIDSQAKVTLKNEFQDSLIIEVQMISYFPDSRENSKFLRDFMLTKIYLNREKLIPNKLRISISPNQKFKYSFFSNREFNDVLFSNEGFIDYVKFILKNLKANEMSYFNITIAVIKELYPEYDYNGTLLDLLLDFYFFHEEDKFIVWFFLFYNNCDFEDGNFSFDKKILDECLSRVDIDHNDWNIERVNELYLRVYGINEIITIDGDTLYD